MLPFERFFSATTALAFSALCLWLAPSAEAAPTDIILDGTTIQENQEPGSLVGIFSTVDSDPNAGHTYALVSGEGDEDNGAFNLGLAFLTTAETFDYETKSHYSIRVRSTSNSNTNPDAPDFVERVFEIAVIDGNDAPVLPKGQTRSIEAGSAAGAPVGNPLVATDQDGHTLTFSIVDGNTDGAFSIDSATGQLLVDNPAAITPRDNPSFTLTVGVSDPHGGADAGEVEIDVVAPVSCEALVLSPDVLTTKVGAALEGGAIEVEGATGNLEYSLAGALPPGVSFEGGVISGAPEEAGLYDLTIEAVDFFACAGTLELALDVTCGALEGAQSLCGEGPSEPLGVALGEGVTGEWSDGGEGGSFSPSADDPNATYAPPAGFEGEIELAFAVDAPGCGAERPLLVPLTVREIGVEGCCVTHFDCDDGDPCSIDTCVYEACMHELHPQCEGDAGLPPGDGGVDETPSPASGGCVSAGASPRTAAPLLWTLALTLGYLAARRRRLTR